MSDFFLKARPRPSPLIQAEVQRLLEEIRVVPPPLPPPPLLPPPAVSPPEGLPKPVAKALNAVQQAAASAAQSAIESAKEAA